MTVLSNLQNGLVVSCQPVDDGPMDRVDIVVAMAQAAVAGGADALRIEGVENLRAVRKAVQVPIIGLVKRDLEDSPVRITIYKQDALDLVDAGADVVAYDGTDRARPDAAADVLKSILAAGVIAMADCATLEDGKRALAGGAGIIGTTMSGYTAQTEGRGNGGPDYELLQAYGELDGFVMAEGRFNTPALAASAFANGADAVTVGSAITRLEHITGWFKTAIERQLG
ncbi:N-acetylmannosamine-6-phosphate 2-epimerase [Polycladidibacter hongkongensis]|uniref:N-acetylmannosamine-6-phosphate 2-epimerase n=1 Tax=Polycladidibacter hongkongensis TaxID=1647556 RepID=UPI00082EAB58|nr:putative N-acetylmannosamine-6-phosphate 2-epimerase [Pseudovibrio hongkongensis]